MSSYLFQEDALIAPPPPEYVEFTQRRAVWTAIGKRKEELAAREWYSSLLFLQMESAKQRRISPR